MDDVRDRVKFRVGRIVYIVFSRDERMMGFAFPKNERAALVASEPAKFLLPRAKDMRYNWVVVRLEHRELVSGDGRRRTYHLYIPFALPAGPVPLLVALHGGTGWGEQFQRTSGFDELAEANGSLVVFPDGIGLGDNEMFRTWNRGYCCGSAAKPNVDDVGFINAKAAKGPRASRASRSTPLSRRSQKSPRRWDAKRSQPNPSLRRIRISGHAANRLADPPYPGPMPVWQYWSFC